VGQEWQCNGLSSSRGGLNNPPHVDNRHGLGVSYSYFDTGGLAGAAGLAAAGGPGVGAAEPFPLS
jgi:hypothetical protein